MSPYLPPVMSLRSLPILLAALWCVAAPAQPIPLYLDGMTADSAIVADHFAILRLHPSASTGWDPFDASKLTPPSDTYALIALMGDRDGAPYRHGVLALPDVPEWPVPIMFKSTHAATYVLTADLAGLPAGWRAELRDLATGAVADLAAGYAFRAEATDWTDRLVLVFVRTQGGATVGESAPAAFRLGAPAPNPAAQRATLALRVDAAQLVTATVVDALGRTVATVFEGTLAAGAEQTLVVPTDRLAPGLYLVRVQGAAFQQSRRLVVAR